MLGLFWYYVVCDLFLLLGSVCCCSLMGWVLVAGVICYLLVSDCVLLCLWVMLWDSWVVIVLGYIVFLVLLCRIAWALGVFGFVG